MKIAVYMLSNRIGFLREAVASFVENAETETRLFIGAQAIDGNLIGIGDERVAIANYQDNIGLNRYDELINFFKEGDIIVDADDDILFPRGFEQVFRDVLSESKVGWVSLLPLYDTIAPFHQPPREHQIGKWYLVEAAAGGHLAATRRETWEKLGGFGRGKTIFDLEDARYQKKCIAAGYLTGVVTNAPGFEHRNSWARVIERGYFHHKCNNLFESMCADIITEEQYRSIIMDGLAVLGEKTNIPEGVS